MSDNAAGQMEEHERFMRRCLELAEIALEQNNAPVGSLIVMDGEIVGEGIEELPTGMSITGHAEILACQMAVRQNGHRQLTGATLYTTAEPCFMCSYVIRQCGISLVVYGLETPVIGGITSSHPILTDGSLDGWETAPRVVGGILAEACQRLRSAKRRQT